MLVALVVVASAETGTIGSKHARVKERETGYMDSITMRGDRAVYSSGVKRGERERRTQNCAKE